MTLFLMFGVHQDSILGPFHFNVCICDMFFDIAECDIASYADDNAPYTSSFSLVTVIIKLEFSTNKLLRWFRENHMKANADEFHLRVTCNTNITAKVEGFSIKNSTEEKLLCIKFDSKLLFENHVSSLCTKASRKLYALARIINYMDIEKSWCIMEAFATFQFRYCSL